MYDCYWPHVPKMWEKVLTMNARLTDLRSAAADKAGTLYGAASDKVLSLRDITDAVLQDMVDTSARTNPDTTPSLEQFKKQLVLMAAVVPLAVYEAYVTKIVWNWFVPGAFGTEPISASRASGINTLVSTLVAQPSRKPDYDKKDIDGAIARLRFSLKMSFVRYSGALIVGGVSKALMRSKK